MRRRIVRDDFRGGFIELSAGVTANRGELNFGRPAGRSR
jgi:hypothetical protein